MKKASHVLLLCLLFTAAITTACSQKTMNFRVDEMPVSDQSSFGGFFQQVIKKYDETVPATYICLKDLYCPSDKTGAIEYALFDLLVFDPSSSFFIKETLSQNAFMSVSPINVQADDLHDIRIEPLEEVFGTIHSNHS